MTTPGNKIFQVGYLENVVEDDIPSLRKRMRNRIKTATETQLAVDPIGLGK